MQYFKTEEAASGGHDAETLPNTQQVLDPNHVERKPDIICPSDCEGVKKNSQLPVSAPRFLHGSEGKTCCLN